MRKLPHKAERLAWKNARERCLKPAHQAWRNYGGRGITFYAPWINDFDAFFAEVGPRPGKCDLDRIDNERGYEPGNIRWVSRSVNARNKRKPPLIAGYFQRNPATASLSELSELTGLSVALLRYRIINKFPDELVTAAQFDSRIVEKAMSDARQKIIIHRTSDGLSIAQACAISGVKPSCAYKRIISYGRTVDEACRA